MLPIDPQRMLADLRALAEFGRLGTGVNRRSLTPEDLAARDWLLERMRAAGLDAQIDGIGSVAGAHSRQPQTRTDRIAHRFGAQGRMAGRLHGSDLRAGDRPCVRGGRPLG